ncbi:MULTISPECIES: RNA polymerase sporulation sigma factor SigK [Caloramator]|uniref:RNA polymerase sigma factor n=1 Tax=Caloramator proteoclasticus DSM 10124 TaxID=1121262 RepID=A0A1M4YAS6_9CLOT|nr:MULTISPECIES: RNA polymerase sporulation sigma factor SigK [Caloramator]SHF02738.1 RNA polymerase, sigma 27/28 subunit, RpsK/SigK [Caloramator proteoclasticus DSM 10124]
MIIETICSFLDGLFLLAGYITNGTSFPKPLTEEEEKRLFNEYKNGNQQAKAELITRNLRLVAHIIKKFGPIGKDSDDLISIGTVGLIKAIESFDYDKGNRLATYAARCIENEILMYMRSVKKVKTEVYLQDPIGVDKEGNEICLMDVLGTESDKILDEVESKISIRKLYRIIDKVLEEKEKIIIKLRYGLCGEPKTQMEIAQMLGISRSYVSRIEKRALKKLAKEMQR